MLFNKNVIQTPADFFATIKYYCKPCVLTISTKESIKFSYME